MATVRITPVEAQDMSKVDKNSSLLTFPHVPNQLPDETIYDAINSRFIDYNTPEIVHTTWVVASDQRLTISSDERTLSKSVWTTCFGCCIAKPADNLDAENLTTCCGCFIPNHNGFAHQFYWHEVRDVRKTYNQWTRWLCCSGWCPRWCFVCDLCCNCCLPCSYGSSYLSIDIKYNRNFGDLASAKQPTFCGWLGCLDCLPAVGVSTYYLPIKREDAARAMTAVHRGIRDYVTKGPTGAQKILG